MGPGDVMVKGAAGRGHDVEHLSLEGLDKEAARAGCTEACWEGDPVEHLRWVVFNRGQVLVHVLQDVSGHGQLRCREPTSRGHLVDESSWRGGRREVVIDDRDVELVGVNRHGTASSVLPFNQSLRHRGGR